MTSGSLRPASGGTRDDRALERDFLDNDSKEPGRAWASILNEALPLQSACSIRRRTADAGRETTMLPVLVVEKLPYETTTRHGYVPASW